MNWPRQSTVTSFVASRSSKAAGLAAIGTARSSYNENPVREDLPSTPTLVFAIQLAPPSTCVPTAFTCVCHCLCLRVSLPLCLMSLPLLVFVTACTCVCHRL